jgi:hypothetical protein
VYNGFTHLHYQKESSKESYQEINMKYGGNILARYRKILAGHGTKFLVGIALLGLSGCAATNRTQFTMMQRDESTFKGVRAEADKGVFRYSIAVEVMDVEREEKGPYYKKIPLIGSVRYEDSVTRRQVNLVPELSSSLLRLGSRDRGLELRLGGGSEVQLTSVGHKYNIHMQGEEYKGDTPLSTLDANIHFFLSQTLAFDFYYGTLFAKARVDDDLGIGLNGGLGIKW